MGCPDAETIVGYVEHEMLAEERQAVAEHLDSCESCRQIVALAATSLLPTSEPSEPGGPTRVVGRYRVHGLLDAGGMGLVFEAEDPKLGRRVALKMLHRGRVSRTELRREARAIASLDHPAVIKIYDVGRVDERDFIVMELVHGGTLREWLRSAPRSHAEILGAFGSIASGLSAVHEVGVVHRDFKPANVLVRADGGFVITDFGLSATGASHPTPHNGVDPVASETSSGLVGTPAYMSPEQKQGELVTAKSDQYSFAVCLVEALAGDKDAVDSPSINRRTRRVLRRAMSEEPAARFRSIDAMWTALTRAMAGQRRGRATATLAGLALFGSVGLFTYSTFAEDTSCIDAAGASHQRLQRDLELASEAADVDPAFNGVVNTMLIQWQEETSAACSLEAEERGRRLRCLDRERNRLEVVLSGLAQGRPGAWDHWRATVDIVRFPKCAAVRDPSDTGNPELQARIDEAEVFGVRNQYLAAIEVLDGVIAEAGTDGPDRALPRALRWRAKMHSQLDDFEAAFVDAEAAHREASAFGQDTEVARAALLLANISYIGGADDSDRWLAAADAAIHRGGDRPGLLALSAEAHARVAYSKGDYEATIDHVGRGLANLTAEQDPVTRSELLMLGAWAHIDSVQYAEALEAASEAARILLEERGPHDFQYVESLRLQSLIARGQGRMDDSIALLQRARDLLRETDNAPNSMMFRAQVTLARAFRGQGRNEEAIAENLSILEEADNWNLADGQRAMTHTSLAWAYIDADKADLALQQVERALVLRVVNADPDPNYALEVAAKGEALAQLGRVDEATVAFDTAIDMLNETLGADSPKPAWVRQLRASARSEQEPEVSRKELIDVIDILTKSMGPDSPFLANAHRDLAEVELKLGNRKAARANVQRAMELLEATNVPDHPALAAMRRTLAELE